MKRMAQIRQKTGVVREMILVKQYKTTVGDDDAA